MAVCSNTITARQVAKIARWARQLSGGKVTLMFDCDEQGHNGALQALGLLAEHCYVRLAWSPASHKGRFRGRQPEWLTTDEWRTVRKGVVG